MKNHLQIDSSKNFINGVIRCCICNNSIETNSEIDTILKNGGKVLCGPCIYKNIPFTISLLIRPYIKGDVTLDKKFLSKILTEIYLDVATELE
jgi:hypothetical protein